MIRKTLSQTRLKGALAAVRAVRGLPGNYKSAAEEGPVMIRTLSLGPALSTMSAKQDGYRIFADQVAEWLLRDCPHLKSWHDRIRANGHEAPADLREAYNAEALLAVIGSKSDVTDYRLIQTEGLAYAQWLKRFAQAFLAGDDHV